MPAITRSVESDLRMPRAPRRGLRFGAAALALLALAACGPDEGRVAVGPGPGQGTTTTSTSSGPGSSSTGPGVSGTATSLPSPTAAPVAEAAGPTRARPADARPITTLHTSEYDGSKTAVIKTPSGNIGCDFAVGGTYAGCGVTSLINSGPTVGGSPHRAWWVDLSGSAARVMPKGDAPYYEYNQPPAQVVGYGSAVYQGDYACRSEETGLTCWNTHTGVGATMKRTGITPLVLPPAGTAPVQGAATPLLGLPGWGAGVGNQEGYGSARPRVVYNGGSPSGRITAITWSSWGGPTADGDGRALNVSNSKGVADAPEEPAKIRAFDLDICNGQLVYRHVKWWFPQNGESFQGTGKYDLCTGK